MKRIAVLTSGGDAPGMNAAVRAVVRSGIDRGLEVFGDTASSHHRAFLVEVMGRDCGYLALTTAIAGGAEAVVLPEYETDPETLAAELACAYDRGKPHAMVVVAEGSRYNAARLMQHFQEHHERLGFQLRATVLGHVQRGGNPSAFDRILATELGAAAVEALMDGQYGRLVGRIDGRIDTTSLDDVVSNKKALDPKLLELARVMAK